MPNAFGGREDLDAIAFLRELNEVVHSREPGVISAAEESTAWPGVSRPTYLGGLGFGFKWNMGWMHDTLDYFRRDPIHRRYHHHELTFSLMYAFTRELHPAALARRGRARQGLAARRRCPATAGSSSRTCARSTRTCGRTPARSCSSWAASSRRSASGTHERSLDWHLLERPEHAGMQRARARPQPRLPRRSPRCGRSTSSRPASAGSSRTTRRATSSPSRGSRLDGDARRSSASATSRRCRASGYRVGLPADGRWREVLNTDSTYYGGSNVGNLGGVEAEPTRWHDQPFSAELDAAAARRRLAACPSGSPRLPTGGTSRLRCGAVPVGRRAGRVPRVGAGGVLACRARER